MPVTASETREDHFLVVVIFIMRLFERQKINTKILSNGLTIIREFLSFRPKKVIGCICVRYNFSVILFNSLEYHFNPVTSNLLCTQLNHTSICIKKNLKYALNIYLLTQYKTDYPICKNIHLGFIWESGKFIPTP